MRVDLKYGRGTLSVDVPEDTRVVAPARIPRLLDEEAAIRRALRDPIGSAPLSSLVKPGDSVVISHSDITRATPNRRLLPILLRELEAAGVSSSDIALLNALGTHRAQAASELRQMLGSGIFDRYTCLQHDAHDDAALVSLGRTSLGPSVRRIRSFV